MLKLLNLEPFEFSEQAKRRLQQYFSYSEATTDIKGDDVTEIIITRLKNKIDRTRIDEFSKLKYIVTATTGTDHIDCGYCAQKQIDIICLKPYPEFLATIPSTAEHTMALMLSLVRNIPKAVNSVCTGMWNRDAFKGIQLRNKKLGIIGMGRTGSKVAAFAAVFGMDICYYDPFVTDNAFTKHLSLEDLISTSDIISLHVHLLPDTTQLINDRLAYCFNGNQYLINTSRGKIADEEFLYRLLKQKALKGVASDVLENEYGEIKNNWLYRAMEEGENVLITPHIAGATIDAMHTCEEFITGILIEKLITHQ